MFEPEFIDQIREAYYSMEVTPLSATIKLGISFVLGAVIGIERQLRRQSAGMRTISLICMASTAAMLLSIWIPQSYPHLLNGDPGRIAAQILTGIGFLGAGAIIQSRGSVHGLTTAATIWVIAIVGMAVGAGMYLPAFLLTVMALFTLIALDRIEKHRQMTGDVKMLEVVYETDTPDLQALRSLIEQRKIFLFNLSVEKNYQTKTTKVFAKIQVKPKDTYDELFKEIASKAPVISISLLTI